MPARDLGVAFQLTNFLRDVGEDLDRGRVYLPQEDLDRFDAADALSRPTSDAGFVQLMRFEIDRTALLYDSADAGLGHLPPASARCIKVAASLYGRILDEIEANGYDVFTDRRSGADVAEGGAGRPHLPPPDPSHVTDVATVARRSPFAVIGCVAFAVMAVVQIWIPLTDDRAGPTVLVVVAAAVATWGFTAHTWGPRRATAAFLWVVAATLVIERIGVGTGWPFGRYHYTGVLQPEVWHVPVIVPLAWFALGIPAREVAIRLAGGRVARVCIAAATLTAWDLFLDPQMVHEGYWRWTGQTAWRGVPLSNFAGWLVVSLVVLAVVDRIAPRGPPDQSGLALVGVYTWWAVMETLGFVAFFGDATVALVGGVAMGVPAVLVWQSYG